jgi:hypothetical protein
MIYTYAEKYQYDRVLIYGGTISRSIVETKSAIISSSLFILGCDQQLLHQFVNEE